MKRNYFTIEISLRAIKITGVVIVSLFLVFGSLAYAYGKVNMSATVAGWFNTKQIDNVNLSVSTNMKVWVNGRQFVQCEANKDLFRAELYEPVEKQAITENIY